MDKIIAALGKLLPDEEVRSEVAGAVNEMLEEAKGELEKEYSSKLEEAYAELSEELKGTEATAEQGYQEAYSIIQDLRNRLDTQRVEFESHMDENFEQAYQMLVQERGKNDNISLRHEQFQPIQYHLRPIFPKGPTGQGDRRGFFSPQECPD